MTDDTETLEELVIGDEAWLVLLEELTNGIDTLREEPEGPEKWQLVRGLTLVACDNILPCVKYYELSDDPVHALAVRACVAFWNIIGERELAFKCSRRKAERNFLVTLRFYRLLDAALRTRTDHGDEAVQGEGRDAGSLGDDGALPPAGDRGADPVVLAVGEGGA